MRIQQLSLLLLTVVLFAASCRKEELEVKPQPASQLQIGDLAKNESNNGLDNRNKQPFVGILTLTPNGATSQLPCACSGLSQPLGTFGGGGSISTVGMLSAQIQSCVTPINTGGMDVTSVCAELIDVNGDKIFTYTYPYQVLPGVAATTLQVDIDGGTGVYSNAKGSFIGTMTISQPDPMLPPTASFAVNGTIKY